MHSTQIHQITSCHNELFQGALVGALTNGGAVSPSLLNPPGFEKYIGAIYKFIASTCRNGILASSCMILAHSDLVWIGKPVVQGSLMRPCPQPHSCGFCVFTRSKLDTKSHAWRSCRTLQAYTRTPNSAFSGQLSNSVCRHKEMCCY
jgi:hypothetical protein